MSTMQEPPKVSNCLTHFAGGFQVKKAPIQRSTTQDWPKVSNGLTPFAVPKKRAGGLLAAKLRHKGWSISSAALYLGVSRQRLYMVFDDPGRARLWDCAIEGLPEFTPQIAEALRAQRPKVVPKPAVHIEEFEVGDVLMCTKYAGIAEEDARGHIAQLRGSGATLEILVVMPDGQDWFPRALFYEHFATTGLNLNR